MTTIIIRCDKKLKREIRKRCKQADTDISKLGRKLFNEFLRPRH